MTEEVDIAKLQVEVEGLERRLALIEPKVNGLIGLQTALLALWSVAVAVGGFLSGALGWFTGGHGK